MGLLHATCVAIADAGVLIRGPSGSGKSDLALRLIDGGADLVSDDICETAVKDGRLVATTPATIAGKIEVRGHGIINLPFRASVAVGLVVDLMPEKDIERMPETTTCVLDGVTLPRLVVDAFSPSATAKVRLVMGSK
jgi:serine kinase of HPr protein (carbohydrate metabolism regulator)